MSPFRRISLHGWLVVPLCAGCFLLWTFHQRRQRVDCVSGLATWSNPAAVVDPGSPTGYARGQRQLIVPERNENSFAWIAQTQQMLAHGEARIRHVDYDNAPRGRDVSSPSPYRWWLALIAWLDHARSGRPLGLSVERAALFADPILQGLWLIGGTVLVARRFGRWAASLFAVGLVAIFPLGAAFLPGGPDDRGLADLAAFGSILFLLAGLNDRRSPTRWFALAGLVGGLGVWISAPTQGPILAGVFLGALMSTGFGRGRPPAEAAARPWSVWALSGAATILAAYLGEYFPDRLASWRLDTVHPLYGVAWIGAGVLLARVEVLLAGRPSRPTIRDVVVMALAVAAMATIPVVMGKTAGQGLLTRNLLWARLTNLPDGIAAASFPEWWSRDGATATLWATVAPLILIVPAGWLMFRRSTPPESRRSLAIALGPVAIALGFAWSQLSWWSVVDSTWLALLVAATAGAAAAIRPAGRWLWTALFAVPAIFGLVQLAGKISSHRTIMLTASEAQEVIERHLAHWLAGRTSEPHAVVYAPPHETTTLAFYGGLRGIGTFAPDNRAGFGTSLAIAAASTMQEAEALLRGHGVRYVVIPSWDPFFDNFAALYLAKNFSNRTSLFIHELRRWHLPLWLRAVPYQLPVGGGFEGQSVRVFEVVDEQSPAAAASRLAEYLIETGDLDSAAAVGETLKRFPGDVGALAARAQTQTARGDTAGAARTVEDLLVRLSTGADRFLPWDRRVSLAIVLAQADRVELAREQTQRCLKELDETKLRSLSTGSLYNLMVLSRALGLSAPDPKLRDLALSLLPVNLRSHR